MILVFGDIHGCVEPLTQLYAYLEPYIQRASHCRLIFLGDYIDRGPASREVVDFIRSIPVETVLLMGNHEDQLLMYQKGSDILAAYGNFWCTRRNGGLKTIQSFDPRSPLPRLIQEEGALDQGSRTYVRNRGEFDLKPQYQTFFEHLRYIHEERVVRPKGDPIRYLFSHATPNPKVPLKEIFRAKSFEHFHALEQQYGIPIDESNIWNRSLLDQRIDNAILVHGHTPTHLLAGSYGSRFGVDRKVMEILRQGHAYFRYEKGGGSLIQINIDTGAVYGNRLSALMIVNDPAEYTDPRWNGLHHAVFWVDADGCQGHDKA